MLTSINKDPGLISDPRPAIDGDNRGRLWWQHASREDSPSKTHVPGSATFRNRDDGGYSNRQYQVYGKDHGQFFIVFVSTCLFAKSESLRSRVSILRAPKWVSTSVPPEARKANPGIVESFFLEQGEQYSERHDESTSAASREEAAIKLKAITPRFPENKEEATQLDQDLERMVCAQL